MASDAARGRRGERERETTGERGDRAAGTGGLASAPCMPVREGWTAEVELRPETGSDPRGERRGVGGLEAGSSTSVECRKDSGLGGTLGLRAASRGDP